MRTVAGLLVGLFLFMGALTLIVISAIVQAVMGLLPLLLLALAAVGVVKIIAARRGRTSTEPQRLPAVPPPAAVAPPTPSRRPPRPPPPRQACHLGTARLARRWPGGCWCRSGWSPRRRGARTSLTPK